jgi:flagellar biosynthesis/type III secretory pathway chaperone
MTSDALNSLLESLDDLLDRERNALLQGDIECLERLTAQKSDLVDVLQSSGRPGGADLEDLRRKATRNQKLMDSARQGIGAVSNRLAELRHLRAGLETYDSTGRKSRVEAQVRPNVERHA